MAKTPEPIVFTSLWPYLQEPFGVTGLSLGDIIRSVRCASSSAAHIAQCGHGGPVEGAASLISLCFHSFKLAFQAQGLLAFLTKLSLSTACLQLGFGVALLELVDVYEESFDLVPSLVDVVIELSVHLVASIDLGLEILDGAINVAQRALLGAVLVLLLFEMGLKL